MGKTERMFLQMRNNGGQGQADETYCKHYKKRAGAYLAYMFFKFEHIAVFLICAAMTALYFIPSEAGEFFGVLPIIFAAITGFAWLCMMIFGLWYWKYGKHVFVTDEGIWVTGHSVFWWRGAPHFTGKRRLLSAYWSLYSWSELKSVGTRPERNNDARIGAILFFENADAAVLKLVRSPSVYMKRWDGAERIDFLTASDAQELREYADTMMKAKRKRSRVKKNADDTVDAQ